MSKISLGGLKNYFSGLKFTVSLSNFFSKISRRTKIIIGILFLIAISLFTIQQIYSNRSDKSISSSNEHPPSSPTCVPKIIPSGRQEFNFSHGKDVLGPKPTLVIVDPLTPEIGESQTIYISVKYPKPILNATAILEVNEASKVINQPLTLSSGTNTDGVWTTTWKVSAPYDCYYHLKYLFQAGKTDDDIYQGGLRFR